MALVHFSQPFDPINALFNLQQEFDRVFDNPRGLDLGLSGRGAFPPMNVFSDAEGYTVRMEIPGVAPENVTVEAHGRTLSVTGKRETQASDNASFHRRERSGGNFSRSLQLPAELALDRTEAAIKHGMLTIRIPKKEEAKPRQITIKAA